MKAKIWVSVPDPTDGYYVEIVDVVGKKKVKVQVADAWKRTIEDCRCWAMIQGVLPENIEEFES